MDMPTIHEPVLLTEILELLQPRAAPDARHGHHKHMELHDRDNPAGQWQDCEPTGFRGGMERGRSDGRSQFDVLQYQCGRCGIGRRRS